MAKLGGTYKALQEATAAIAPDVIHSDYRGDICRTVTWDSFDTVLAEGKVIFRRTFERWESGVYDSPTVSDALMATQESIDATGDKHHTFYEGVEVLGTVLHTCPTCHNDIGDVTLIEIITGS